MITLNTNIPSKTPTINAVEIGSLPIGSMVQLVPNHPSGDTSVERFNSLSKMFVRALITDRNDSLTTVLRCNKTLCDEGTTSFPNHVTVIPLTVKNLELEAQFKF